MREESYSFIWQPWVWMNSLPRTAAAEPAWSGEAGAVEDWAGWPGEWGVVMAFPGHGG